MPFGHPFHSVSIFDIPIDIIWDIDYFDERNARRSLLGELLHDLHKARVISGEQGVSVNASNCQIDLVFGLDSQLHKTLDGLVAELEASPLGVNSDFGH
jgi:hypothetical protein